MKFLEGHQAHGREICISIHKLYRHLLVTYIATALYGHSVGGVIMCSFSSEQYIKLCIVRSHLFAGQKFLSSGRSLMTLSAASYANSLQCVVSSACR